MSGASKESVDIMGAIDPKSGQRIWRTQLTPKEDQRIKTIYAKPPAVIPIVFLPGIMGTNLKTRGTTNAAWRPPNGTSGGLAAVFTWMWRGPKARQVMLDMNTVEVDWNGPISVSDSGLSEALARKRGWGSVMKSSYHPVMALMQQALNGIAAYSAGTPLKSSQAGPVLRADWKKSGMVDPSEYGEQCGIAALT